jgi:probable O-glycosylation ligase (exosortase A-associated)
MSLGAIATYIMTFGGGIASLFNPFIGLLFYIAFSIIRPYSLWGHWLTGSIPYVRVVALALFVGWALHGLGKWNFGRGKLVVYAFIAYWVWAVLSAMFAPNQQVAWAFIENTAKILIPFVVGATLIDSVDRLKQFVWVLVISLGYIAFEMNLSYYQGFNKMQMMGHGGMGNNGTAIAMASGVGVAFFLGISENRMWLRGIAWFATLLMAHSVMLAFSRGGMLALVVTGIVGFFLLPPKKPKHLFGLILVIILALRLAGQGVTDRFMTIFADSDSYDGSAQSRLDLWASAWDTMIAHPLLGVGPDHWGFIAPKYGWVEGKEVHSTWFQTGAELGFLGLIFLAAYYLLSLLKLWPILREKVPVDDPYIYSIARMVFAGLVGFMASSQFVSLEGLEFPYFVALLGVGALRLVPEPEPAPRFRRAPALSAASVFPEIK